MAKDKLDEDVVEPTSKKKDNVEIPKDTLQKMMDRLEKLEKDNELLKEVSDKEKLRKIEELRNGGKLVKNVNLNTLNNKIIIGWSKIKDDVYFDEQGRLHEEQIIAVVFQDGSKTDLDYRSFSRLSTKLKGEVISESKDRDGNSNMKVLLPDGREIDIDIKFIN